MSTETGKKIGILGGMGPEATVLFYNLIIRLTKAERDNEHIPVIIYSNPKVPDRTEAIINNAKSPLPLLLEGAKFLQDSGVDVITMPCITAHHFYPEIIKNIKTHFLNIIQETADYTEKKHPNLKKLGLLATNGTIKTEIFQKYFERRGIEIILPDKKNQTKFMDAVYGKKGIKAGFKIAPKKILLQIVEHLHKNNAQAIIAGCTEVPLALQEDDISIPFIEPLFILASKSIKMVGYPSKD